MNRKDRIIQTRKNWNEYHVPGMGNYTTVKKNVLFIRKANSYEHEKAKFDECWKILKAGHEYITEAERNRKRGEARVIVDIVNITTLEEIEIETKKARAKGLMEDEKKRNVRVIKLWQDKKEKATGKR